MTTVDSEGLTASTPEDARAFMHSFDSRLPVQPFSFQADFKSRADLAREAADAVYAYETAKAHGEVVGIA